MAMVSLERKKEEDGEGGESGDCCSPSYYHQRYPLSMYVSDEEFEKLKLGGKKISEEFELTIKVRVTSLSVNQYNDDGKSETKSNATLTVLAADVPDEGKPASDRMFGAKED